MRPLTDSELWQRVVELRALQRPCQLCPRRCGVPRTARQLGFCGQPRELRVAAVCPHGGEEPPLSGTVGAGTVFVAGCTMRCSFCQNHQISQAAGAPAHWSTTPEALAERFLELQRRGCHNIEWVSPTQHLPGLVEALAIARRRGLGLPLVWNCNGYQRVTVLRLLEGIVDVYLPDAKYASDQAALRFSGTDRYVDQSRRALLEMWRQVGPLQLDERGLARRGLLIRHLVLPGQLESTRQVLSWIATTLGDETHVSLLAQFYPAHRAAAAGLHRRLTRREYHRAMAALAQAGLENGWIQQLATDNAYRPDFFQEDPFAAAAPSPSLADGGR